MQFFTSGLSIFSIFDFLIHLFFISANVFLYHLNKGFIEKAVPTYVVFIIFAVLYFLIPPQIFGIVLMLAQLYLALNKDNFDKKIKIINYMFLLSFFNQYLFILFKPAIEEYSILNYNRFYFFAMLNHVIWLLVYFMIIGLHKHLVRRKFLKL